MNKNLALTLTAATLFIVIGIMAAWWFNGGNIDSVKPYVDPYNNYTEAELTAMQDKGETLKLQPNSAGGASTKVISKKLMLYIRRQQTRTTQKV